MDHWAWLIMIVALCLIVATVLALGAVGAAAEKSAIEED